MRKINHTFVIPAYKDNEYLEECIASLKNQTVKGNILITTPTPSKYIDNLAKKYKIKVIVNSEDKGAQSNFNFAIDCAKTEYVTLAHQDDVYANNYLEEVLKVIKSNENILIIFTDYIELRNSKKIENNKLLKMKRLLLFPLRYKIFYNNKFVRRTILSLGNAICCPSVTMNKNTLDIPIFNSKLRGNVDWDTWEKISKKKGGFIYINKPLVWRRIHEQSDTSGLIASNQRRNEDFEMFQKFWPNFIAKVILKYYSRAEQSNDLKQFNKKIQ